MLHGTKKIVASLSLLMLTAAGNLGAQQAGGVSGVVRDTHGKPQMGVMVDLLGPAAVATALTDLEGHYRIKDVLPGVYQLRASASLYLPSLRRQLRITPGTRPVVNLTMSGLFDETAWLSGTYQSTIDGPDDWKWTLRSPANRPMLRLASEDGTANATNREQGSLSGELHGVISAAAGSGGFGRGDDRGTLAVVHHSGDQKRSVGFRSSVGVSDSPVVTEPVVLSMMVETNTGFSNKRRADVRLRSFPQVRDGRGDSLKEVSVTSAERIDLGDLVALEVGSEMQVLTTNASILVTHPFLRLTSRPARGWKTSYAFATTPSVARYDDLAAREEPTPTAVETGTGLKTEAGTHHEIATARNLGRARIRIAYSHDSMQQTALTGVLPHSSRSTSTNGDAQADFVTRVALDTSNGSFRTLAQGFGTNGGSVFVDFPTNDHFSISGGYLTGTAIHVVPSSENRAAAHLATARAQALLIGLQGRSTKTGTKIMASYRWQPSKAVSVVSPYEMAATPFLSVHMRQILPIMKDGSLVELTFDGDNLLQEGYQGYGLGGQEALLASALQELRAGVSFTF